MKKMTLARFNKLARPLGLRCEVNLYASEPKYIIFIQDSTYTTLGSHEREGPEALGIEIDDHIGRQIARDAFDKTLKEDPSLSSLPYYLPPEIQDYFERRH